MTLTRSIDILHLIIRGTYVGDNLDREAALKLGIEALKRIKRDREGIISFPDEMLPAETNEGTARGCRSLLT